jgi:hypothetical protein
MQYVGPQDWYYLVLLCQWAHFPHIHFGLMPDQAMKKNNVRQQVTYAHSLSVAGLHNGSSSCTQMNLYINQRH